MSRLHHVALGAIDVERVASFYRDVLDLPETARHEDARGLRSVWLSLGPSVLMIERTDEPLRRVQGVGAGPFLLALTAPSGAEAALARLGVVIESRSEYTLYFRDPEGNRVALSRYPLPAGA